MTQSLDVVLLRCILRLERDAFVIGGQGIQSRELQKMMGSHGEYQLLI